MHKNIYSITGYDDPNHWCSVGKKNIGTNPIVGGNTPNQNPVNPTQTC